MRSIGRYKGLLSFMLAMFAFAGAPMAQQKADLAVGIPSFNLSDVMVAPTRVVFEGKTRTAEVFLINKSTKRFTYQIAFTNHRMSESGVFTTITEPGPGERFAQDYVRYTPRRVIIDPGKTQVVRLQLTKPSGLAEGEYRSHLVFQVVPDSKKDGDPASPEEEQSITISLTPIYGISIPIIIREGATFATATLKELAFRPIGEEGKPTLDFTIYRAGNQSLHGDFIVEYVLPGKQPVQVARMAAMSVYIPLERRLISIPLTVQEGLTLRGGTLRLSFVDPRKARGAAGYLLATASAALP